MAPHTTIHQYLHCLETADYETLMSLFSSDARVDSQLDGTVLGFKVKYK